MKKIYLIATIVALLTALSVYMFVQEMQAREVKPAGETVTVVTAASDLPEKTVLTEEMLILKSLPAEAALKDAAKSTGALIGGILKYPISAGEQVLTSKLDRPGSENAKELSVELANGRRAISIPIPSEDIGVAGYIRKGDRVDIIVTKVKEEEDSVVSDTSFFIEKARVLKISSYSEDSKGTPILTYSTITLSVSPEEALALSSLLSDVTPISKTYRIVLRPLTDEELANTPPYKEEKTDGQAETSNTVG